MKILAIESTAKVASVALTEDDRLLAMTTADAGVTHSEILLPMAEEILSRCHTTFADVGLFACTIGPGSFTGVRIGVATVKGLAFGRGTPCVGISSTEALAEHLTGLSGIVCPVMDARRGQLYTATFRVSPEGVTRLCPDRAMDKNDLAKELASYHEPVYLNGDGVAIEEAALRALGSAPAALPPLLLSPNAYSCARVAYRKYLTGESVSDRDLRPVYLRLPQAERERLERLAKEKKD